MRSKIPTQQDLLIRTLLLLQMYTYSLLHAQLLVFFAENTILTLKANKKCKRYVNYHCMNQI